MQQLFNYLPLIAMLVIFYLVIFIPENRRKKKYNSMIASLKINDEIMTRGGIIGKIVNVQEDFVIIQTGPDKSRIKLSKSGILNIMAGNTEEKQ